MIPFVLTDGKTEAGKRLLSSSSSCLFFPSLGSAVSLRGRRLIGPAPFLLSPLPHRPFRPLPRRSHSFIWISSTSEGITADCSIHTMTSAARLIRLLRWPTSLRSHKSSRLKKSERVRATAETGSGEGGERWMDGWSEGEMGGGSLQASAREERKRLKLTVATTTTDAVGSDHAGSL